MRTPLMLALGSWLLSTGCGGGDLPGHYWNVEATGVENACTGNGAQWSDSFDYRVTFDGNDIVLAVGEDVFATGFADGCSLSYQSIVWGEDVEGDEVRWQILGSARVDPGGGAGCVADSDWDGTEIFEIVNSEHPDISVGCTYSTQLIGTWEMEVQ